MCVPVSEAMPVSVPVSLSSAQPVFCLQVLIAGGSAQNCAQYDTPASNQSFLVDVTPGANHAPTQETMHFPRVVSASPMPAHQI